MRKKQKAVRQTQDLFIVQNGNQRLKRILRTVCIDKRVIYRMRDCAGILCTYIIQAGIVNPYIFYLRDLFTIRKNRIQFFLNCLEIYFFGPIGNVDVLRQMLCNVRSVRPCQVPAPNSPRPELC